MIADEQWGFKGARGCVGQSFILNHIGEKGGVMKEVKMGMERRGVSFLEDERGWRLPGLLYAVVGGPEGNGGMVC